MLEGRKWWSGQTEFSVDWVFSFLDHFWFAFHLSFNEPICTWIKLFFIWKALHYDSLSHRGQRQLGNRILCVLFMKVFLVPPQDLETGRNTVYLNNPSCMYSVRLQFVFSVNFPIMYSYPSCTKQCIGSSVRYYLVLIWHQNRQAALYSKRFHQPLDQWDWVKYALDQRYSVSYAEWYSVLLTKQNKNTLIWTHGYKFHQTSHILSPNLSHVSSKNGTARHSLTCMHQVNPLTPNILIAKLP